MADIKIDSDSGKFKAGADQDLEVYSDGSHSYVKNTVNDQTIILSTKTGGSNTSGITLDGSNNVTLLGNIIMADDTSIGIADDAERIEFDGAGDISVLGANFGIGTATPSETLHIEGATSDVLIKNTGTAAVKLYGDAVPTSDESFLMDISGRWDGTRVGVIGITAGPDTTNKDDGSIVFYTASPTLAERMRIDHSGNVGIGTSAPARNLVISSSGQTDVSIIAGTSASAQLQFGDSGDDNIGQIEYNNSDNDMAFTTNAVERLSITSAGVFQFKAVDGGAESTTLSTNAAGHTLFGNDTANRDMNYNVTGTGTHYFGTAAGNMVTFNNSGNVGIGTTAPASLLHIAKDGGNAELTLAAHSDTGGHAGYLTFKKSDNTELSPALVDDDDILGGLSFQGYTNAWVEGALIKAQISGTPSTASNDLPTELTFHTMDESTALAQRMVILPNGKVGIGIAAPTQKLHVFDNSTITVLKLENDHDTAPQGMQLEFGSASPNNTTQEAFKFADNANNRCIIWSNGDIDNTNNSYSAFSDERIKNSITDASSQWDDIKAIKVRKFKKNSDVLQYGEDAPIHIGVVAQEVESAGMSGLVFEHPADEIEIANNENISEGDMVKSVKYSIIYMKAIKALQEAMTRIEALENA